MEFHDTKPAGDYAAFDKVADDAFAELKGEEHIIDNMKIAIKEVFSNVREHAYQLDLTKPVYFSITVTNEEVIATVLSVSKAWRRDGLVIISDAQDQLLAMALNEAVRGRGHYLIALTTDRFEYHNSGRVCILAWKRNGYAGGEAH